MIPIEIILVSSGTQLEMWAQLAEIIIATGTIFGLLFSIWFSIKNLKKSDWNSNMSTAPSITINNSSGQFWISSESDGGGSWGNQTRINQSDDYITYELGFLIANQGRGVALSIQKPSISCPINHSLKDISIPVSIGIINENEAGFCIRMTEQHSKWLELSKNKVNFEIILKYNNDQGNVFCTSKWKAELKPFDVDGTSLIVRDRGDKILKPKMEITYSSLN